MFCGACGTKNDDGQRFCKKCGADLMQFMVPGQQASANRPQPQMQHSVPRAQQRPSAIPNPGPAVRPGTMPAAQAHIPGQNVQPTPTFRAGNGNVSIPRGPVMPVQNGVQPAQRPVQQASAYVRASGLHAAPSGGAPGQIGNPRKGTTVLDDLMSTPQSPSSSELPRVAADAPRSASAPKVTLVRERGTRYSITEFPASVGKGSAANVRIEGNSAISRVHALITHTGTGFVIEDKGSTNGTYLNGDILAQGELVKLHAGDTLTLGDEDFKVEIR